MRKQTHRQITGIVADFGRNGLKSIISHMFALIGVGMVLSGAKIDTKFGLTVMMFGTLVFIAGILHSRLIDIEAEVSDSIDLSEVVGDETAFLYKFSIGSAILLGWTNFWIGVLT